MPALVYRQPVSAMGPKTPKPSKGAAARSPKRRTGGAKSPTAKAQLELRVNDPVVASSEGRVQGRAIDDVARAFYELKFEIEYLKLKGESFHSRSGVPTFHELYGYEQLSESTMAKWGTRRQQKAAPGGTVRRGLSVDGSESRGPQLSDVWEIGVIAPIAKERTGYQTQKPEKLLKRVILASSNPGDTVLDPFCGSGTTLAVAQRLGRRPIGIDQNPHAVEIARRRITTEAA